MASGIHPSFFNDIPDFIIDSIVYCDSLTFKRNEKSCFLLAKNLKFYEFRKKQLLNSLDLNGTCLSSIREQIETYRNNAFSQKSKSNDDAANDNFSGIKTTKEKSLYINIGKYIYRNFKISKLYLLLHCWDKLIVMAHNVVDGLKLTAEYEKVKTFEISPNALIKYQAEVKIQFEDGIGVTCTNFQEDHCNATKLDGDSNGSDRTVICDRTEFKRLHERIRVTEAELQLHKEITQKQFHSLCNAQNFGNNFVRSTKLEEKCMLSKCGDLWMRVTATDELVLGVPLVNNCEPPNLTTLKNLRPIININEESPNAAEANNNNLNFEHRLYQLRQTFENLETLETLFQTQDVHLQGETMWQREETNELQPNSFIVMLLKVKLSQLILINSPCQLFVRFEVEKDLEAFTPKTQIFVQHLFVKTLDFQQVLRQRSLHEVGFHEQTLHQDLLAIAMISFDTKLKIEFSTQNDFKKFEHSLAAKFDFEIVRRKVDTHTSCDATTMDIDEPSDDSGFNFTATLFYNRKPNSLWFGSLVLRHAIANFNAVDDDNEPLQSNWIFYNKNEENSFIMIKLLFDELISIKCNINSVEYAKHQCDLSSKLISFETAIREELNVFSELYKIKNDSQKFREYYKKLAEYQFRTDKLANEL